MKNQHFQHILTLLNLALLLFLLSRTMPAAADDVAPMLRGRGLEIVDGSGRVRASVQVIPASKQKNGEVYPETVLLRLITEKGRPAVKIDCSEQGAAFMCAGPTGTKNTYAQILARGTTTSLVLKNEDGKEEVLKP